MQFFKPKGKYAGFVGKHPAMFTVRTGYGSGKNKSPVLRFRINKELLDRLGWIKGDKLELGVDRNGGGKDSGAKCLLRRAPDGNGYAITAENFGKRAEGDWRIGIVQFGMQEGMPAPNGTVEPEYQVKGSVLEFELA